MGRLHDDLGTVMLICDHLASEYRDQRWTLARIRTRVHHLATHPT